MNMTLVQSCSVEHCAYNRGKRCHALAITVGDSIHPHCDTFCPSSGDLHGGDESAIAGVGACKMASCLHNRDLICGAPAITVRHRGDDIVDCQTYRHR